MKNLVKFIGRKKIRPRFLQSNFFWANKYFGQNHFWQKNILVEKKFAEIIVVGKKTSFGQNKIWVKICLAGKKIWVKKIVRKKKLGKFFCMNHLVWLN